MIILAVWIVEQHVAISHQVSNLAKDHVEIEGVIDALKVILQHNLLQVVHCVDLSQQALREELRPIMPCLELLKREHLAFLAAHDVVVECNEELSALLDRLLSLCQFVTEEINCSLVTAVEEHCLRLLCQLAR